MKFQKVDQKQVPQLAALGVLTLGVFVFAGYSLLSAGGGPTAKAAAAPPAAASGGAEGGAEGGTPESGGQPGEGGQPAEGAQPGVATAPELQLPSIHNDDPFRPAIKPEGPVKVTPAAPAPSGEPKEPRGPVRSLPPAGGPQIAFQPVGPAAPAKPEPPPPPVRPDVSVTGIIDADGGVDMALVSLGTEQRIIQVGDLLPNNYRVKKIAMDGVLLVNGKDKFFVALGNKTQQAEAPGAAPGRG